MKAAFTAILVAASLTIAACTGVTIVRAGATDARQACQLLAEFYEEDLDFAGALAVMVEAEKLATLAAAANEEFNELKFSIVGFNQAMVDGNRAEAETNWIRIANSCNSLT